jgi:secreted PhoX family phosphatase
MWSHGVEFDHATRGTGKSQLYAFGDNNDGMALFTVGDRNILAVNNEYVNRKIIYGNRESGKPENVDDVHKGKAGHGVSIIEIAQRDGKWGLVMDSPYNRKITADAPMEITGPARGHDLLKTAADPSGTKSLGTWNNCANGRTPWGTYLACEENFNGYFSSSDENYVPSAAMKRYGVGNKDRGYAWATADERFDISKHPNEPNRAGYVVEIDPLDPTSTPKKRTALGRFKHENAEVVIAANGKVAVYMGDDERGEFLYRFVSNGTYVEGGDNTDLLEDGKLYVARFSDKQRGEWVELTPAATGLASRAEVCIYSRLAASAVGATTMDRPEWVAAHPKKAEVYCALTNNKNRGKKPNAGGDATPVGGPNPRAANNYGQIVRWRPDGGDHTAPGFEWDLFVMAGNPTVHSDAYAGSKNVNADNMFNSPDGISFDSNGLLWIQTDGNYSNEKDFAGMGNNQMLVGDTETGEIARFMVGPKQCEITGMARSPDRKTMFVGIQHPGERGDSHFPGGGDTVPRSTIIAITRDDGGVIG